MNRFKSNYNNLKLNPKFYWNLQQLIVTQHETVGSRTFLNIISQRMCA